LLSEALPAMMRPSDASDATAKTYESPISGSAIWMPAPIGLTRAEVERVDPQRKELVVSGADIVDGTPILDVKPLVPWRDEGAAQIPEWAAWHGEEDTLHIGCRVSESCEEALKSAWQQSSHGKVLESEARFVRLVKEMLALDIRSYRSAPFIAIAWLPFSLFSLKTSTANDA